MSRKKFWDFEKKYLHFLKSCDIISRQLRDASKTINPGVAKFGIALEWGSRGRWFESSHSDQNHQFLRKLVVFLLLKVICFFGIFGR